MAVSNLVRVVATVATTTIGFELGSVPGFMIGNALGSLCAALFIGWVLKKRGVSIVLLDVVATSAFVVVGLVGCGLPVILEPVVGVPSAYLTLGSVVVLLGPISAWVFFRMKSALRGSSG
jgi:hypothetical protein